MVFRDRRDAGRQLAERLRALDLPRPLVLALPRGGVPVGYEIARVLDAPLDLVMVRKLPAPGFPELALGAVVDGDPPGQVINEDIRRELGVSDQEVGRILAMQLAEIARRRAAYAPGRPPPVIPGRSVILVDDGIATGATMRVALQSLQGSGAGRRVMAVPVAPPEAVAALVPLCDEAVVLLQPHALGAVGRFYEDFTQTEDAEVIDLLHRAGRKEDR
ncbi:phosphoribosyltransferase family protein [Roseomonas gilardii]|uniref:Phosphoribosyltransferase family protein n=1 Tax=Roseomonas gilardii TaxID=257708 RepID=A0ABU3ME02_9PROT|nr:phosphoribosyltransferase family protein [Roseomonas gilardii]MDT8331132.1 phosphoribosyltransferase family protein [Roseomonas gilardii]